MFRIHPPDVFAVGVAWAASFARPADAGAGITPWIARFVEVSPPANAVLATPSRLAWYGLDFARGIAAFQQRDAIARALGALPTAARAAVPIAGALLFAAPVAFFAKRETQGVLVNANDAIEVAVMGAGSVLLGIAAVALPGLARAVGARPFAWLGRISYSVDLLHHTLIALVVGGSILLSIPSHRFVELPSIALGRRVARSPGMLGAEARR